MSANVKTADLAITIVVTLLKAAGLGPEADRILDAIEGAKSCIGLIDDIKNEIVSDPNKELIRSLFKTMEEEVRSIKADLKEQGLGKDEIESTADALIETTRLTVKQLAQDDDALLDAARLPDSFFKVLVHRAEPLPDWCDNTIGKLYEQLLKRVSAEFIERAKDFDRFDKVALASLLRDTLSAKKQRNRIERGVQEGHATGLETYRLVKEDQTTNLETNRVVKELAQRSLSSTPSRVFFGSRPDVVVEDRFVERDEQEQLEALITDPKRQRTVLVGMRGCGKTQLAATLAKQCEGANWSLVAWINAVSRESIQSDLVELAKQFGIGTSDHPTQDQVIHSFLSRVKSAEPADRLIVFDNVEDINDLRSLVPSGDRLRVVATTTNITGWEHQDWNRIKVGLFDRSESIDYLLTVTKSDDHDTADVLAKRLGDLPLAIAQAAAFAQKRKLNLAQYLDRLDAYRSGRVMPAIRGHYYARDVTTALRVTIDDTLKELEAGMSRAARRHLCVLALLAESGVPTRWLDPLTEGHHYQDPRDRDRAADDDAHDALTELIDRSIIQQSADGSTTMLHRLQAQVLRESWNDKEREQANESAAKLLGSVDIDKFHRIDTASRRRETLDLIEQLRAIGEQTQSQDVFNFEELSLSLGRAFIHARDVGLLFEACTLEIPVEAICKRLGTDHPVSLVQLNDLAYAYQNAGRVAQAISLYKQVLPNSSRILGMDHPTTLASRNNLASAYQEAGQLIEAIAAYKQLVMDSTQFLGTDHPYTLTSCNNLGHAYLEAGQLAEAIAAYEKVLTDRTRILGPSHPDTLLSRNNLAYAYTEAGHLGEAVTLYKQLVIDSTQLLGPDHPKTLMARDNLASALCSAGDLAEAIFQYEQLSNDSARILGEDHPDTLTSLHNLACTYLKADRFNDAISLFERVITGRTRVFGEGHPDTLAALHNLALTYSEIGDFDNAIPLSEQVLSNTIRIFGAKHPKTLTSRSNVASAYLKTGRLAEAIPMFKQVLTESIRILGTDHPDVLTTKNNLAYAYQEAGHLAEAISMYEQILIDSTQILDTDHPDIMDARQNLAYAYQSAGRYTDAFTLCKQNLAESTRILGTNNPKTITARNSLAYAYARGGRHSEAASLFVQVFEERARVLGVDHPDTLASRHNLVVTYLAPTDPATAFEMLSDIFSDCMRVLGPQHPLTVSVQENLALTTLKLAQQEHNPHADEHGTQD